jgi:hypothetical protein
MVPCQIIILKCCSSVYSGVSLNLLVLNKDSNLWKEKLDLVKDIIVRLAQGMKYLTPEERASFELEPLPAEAFLDTDGSTITVNGAPLVCRYLG